jgi:ATP-dependent RNA helicase DeaD
MIQRVTGTSLQRMKLPTISDVIERRHEVFKESLRETISQAGLEQYLIMVESMNEEFSPTEVAAAAFKMLLGPASQETEDKLAEPERPKTAEVKPTPKRQHRDREFDMSQGMTRLYIDVGTEDGVRPGDIVGAIANEADIPGRAIGAIELYERFCLVDVPTNLVEQVLAALKNTRIRNQKITASRSKPVKKPAQSQSQAPTPSQDRDRDRDYDRPKKPRVRRSSYQKTPKA